MPTNLPLVEAANSAIAKIAEDFLGIENMSLRVNNIDVHELSSDQIKAALSAAFMAGRKNAGADNAHT